MIALYKPAASRETSMLVRMQKYYREYDRPGLLKIYLLQQQKREKRMHFLSMQQNHFFSAMHKRKIPGQ